MVQINSLDVFRTADHVRPVRLNNIAEFKRKNSELMFKVIVPKPLLSK